MAVLCGIRPVINFDIVVLFLDIVQRYDGYSDSLSILPFSVGWFQLQVNPLRISITWRLVDCVCMCHKSFDKYYEVC
jgi:hypothetical protein